jgi:hypothetical protein
VSLFSFLFPVKKALVKWFLFPLIIVIRSFLGLLHAFLYFLGLDILPVLEGCFPLLLIFLLLLLLQMFLPALSLPHLFRLGLQESNRQQQQKQEEKNPDQEQFNYLCPVLIHAMNKYFSISKLGLFFGILATAISFTACVKDNKDVVPYARIDLILDLSTDLSHLGPQETATITPNASGIGGVIRFTNPQYPVIPLGAGQILQGNGVIIYRSDVYEYEVFDITCTFQAQTDYCRLDRSEDFEGLYICPCCESKFLVQNDGFVFEGPAAMPLKRYPSFIDNNALIVRN